MFIDFSIALLGHFYFILPCSFLGFDVAKLEEIIEIFLVVKGVEVLVFYFFNTVFRQAVAEFLGIFSENDVMLARTGKVLEERAKTGRRLDHQIYLDTIFCSYGSFFVALRDGLVVGEIKEVFDYRVSFMAFGGNVDVSDGLVLTTQTTENMEFGLGKFGLEVFDDLLRDLFGFCQGDSSVLADEAQSVFEN